MNQAAQQEFVDMSTLSRFVVETTAGGIANNPNMRTPILTPPIEKFQINCNVKNVDLCPVHAPDAKRRSDTDMSLSNVEAINTLHGLVLPVGTGICRSCRKLLLDGQNIKSVNNYINQEKITNKILDENNLTEVHNKQTRKIDQVKALDYSGPIKRTRQTITVKSDPFPILEDTCSQETCESEQACLSQTSESSICNSMKLEALNSLLSFSGSTIWRKDLKLTNGEIIKIPSVIRSLAPSTIILQYTALYKEENINPLGSSTLYKLLEDCAALVRRSIEGLDNFVMEGCRAFRDLESVVHKLGLNNAESKSVLENLQNAKRYLKSELKVEESILAVKNGRLTLLDQETRKRQDRPCDRRASHVKSIIRRYINEGHDVTTAQQMKEAIDREKKKDIKVKVVSSVNIVDVVSSKSNIPSISLMYNFHFTESGLRMWKAFSIGEENGNEEDSRICIKEARNSVFK
ncbi:unnamed protein product [Mytilus edulis]|uniref:Uncharacterized protein n=1 Tax=Mytilus edulis TaxID=6550 RepID=A0A8S3UZK8_MYTED|nr:unnamed protein product [Mytilus edulis]